MLTRLYPDQGPLRRELYSKHLEFFRTGLTHRERLFLAANQIGKTLGVGGFETTLHLTGRYPSWWEGARFHEPIQAWAAGDTSKTVRDIIQLTLLGPYGRFGTGLIPQETLNRWTPKQGISDAVEGIFVKHISGGESEIMLKSYDQKREAFQGTKKHIIWLDEEPPSDIYGECLTRTINIQGAMLILTFTPLQGLTELVKEFMPELAMDESEETPMGPYDDVVHE